MRKSANHQIIKLTSLGILLLFVLAGCVAVPAAFTPMQPIGPDQFSHRLFDEVLHAHVQDGTVNYSKIAGDARFQNYVLQLDHVDPNAFSTKNEQLAFWINAYNAFAIQGILEGLSPSTLYGRYEFFIRHRYQVGGGMINLYDLERAILVCDGAVIHGHHLPPSLQTADASGTVTRVSLKDAVAAYERDLIQDALKTTRGNRAKAARLLDTTERILNYKVRGYGIDSRRFRSPDVGRRIAAGEEA